MLVHATIEPLPWESEFFQRHSGKLLLSPSAPPVGSVDLDLFALVQAKIPAQQPDMIDFLSALGFRLVEGEVDLSLPFPQTLVGAESASFSSLHHHIRAASAEDIPALRAAAAQVFSLSRFRAPWYQEGDSGRFYAMWVEKAVLGTFDHHCLLVLNQQGQTQGFVTLRDLGQSEARIGLLAAFPGATGQGIGTQLMAAAKQWCQQQGIHRLRIATQIGNVAALRLYIRHGATIESTAYWLYRGLHDSI